MQSHATTVLIPLSRGFFAIVDVADLPLVAGYSWWAKINGNTVYAAADIQHGPGKRERLLMHRVIMNASRGEMVDHIDGNGLNNRRANLRIATKSQNMMNSRVRRDSSSGYRGVTFCRFTGRWQANIKAKGKRIFLGRYDTPEEASEVYQKAAEKYFGEFRRVDSMGQRRPHGD